MKRGKEIRWSKILLLVFVVDLKTERKLFLCRRHGWHYKGNKTIKLILYEILRDLLCKWLSHSNHWCLVYCTFLFEKAMICSTDAQFGFRIQTWFRNGSNVWLESEWHWNQSHSGIDSNSWVRIKHNWLRLPHRNDAKI